MEYDTLSDILADAGYDAEPYSGRGMYGAQCVSVSLDSDADLWRLATELARVSDEDIPPPRTDTLGYGIVAYWPRVKLVEAA